MKVGFIIAGLVFLFNPNINIVDIMPDAIGFGLILYGILPLSRTETNMSDAARAFRNLFTLELFKIAALYVYALVSSEEQIWILLLTMVFGGFEIYFGFVAWNNLFNSLDYLGDSETQPGVFAKMKTARIFTLVFTVVKPVLAVLPDLTLLDDGRYGEVTDNGIRSLRSFRGMFNVMSALLMLVVGIVWLCVTVSYFKGVKREKGFIASVCERAEQYYREDKKLTFRFYITALSFLAYAFLLCFELKVEGYSLVPPMINGALFLIFFFLVRKNFGKEGKRGLWAAACYFVLSTAGWIFLVLFARCYFIEDSFGFAEVILNRVETFYDIFDQLLGINIVVALSQVAFIFMLVSLYRILRSMIDTHTGCPESMISERDRTDAMRDQDERSDRSIKQGLRKSLKTVLVVGIISAVSSAVFPMLQVYFNSFFMIDLVIRILFVVVSYSFAGKLRHAVKVKAALDFE